MVLVKEKKPKKKIKKVKETYTVRIFTPDNKEYDNKDKKFKTRFRSRKKAEKFVNFYKVFYPDFEFRIEKK